MTLPGPTDVGVIIGRFQVPNLHAGHKNLINSVFTRHKRVLILLGVPVWVNGKKNPLDYLTRKAMILENYPSAVVEYIKDCQTNEIWSESVDRKIRELFPFSKITLYGGRDGFTRLYSGEFPTIETLEDPTIDSGSGTKLREETAALPIAAMAFRAGVIYTVANTPERPIMCVDAAIIREVPGAQLELLLIQKPNEKLWRFPGGHLDGTDASLESAVNREAREETGVEVGKPIYITSECGIPEWRAIQGGLALASSLFFLPYLYGAAQGSDDAAEAQWFNLEKLGEDNMEPCHKSFLTKLKQWVAVNKNLIVYSLLGKSKEV